MAVNQANDEKAVELYERSQEILSSGLLIFPQSEGLTMLKDLIEKTIEKHIRQQKN